MLNSLPEVLFEIIWGREQVAKKAMDVLLLDWPV
jgi:hypothetical protein